MVDLCKTSKHLMGTNFEVCASCAVQAWAQQAQQQVAGQQLSQISSQLVLLPVGPTTCSPLDISQADSPSLSVCEYG